MCAWYDGASHPYSSVPKSTTRNVLRTTRPCRNSTASTSRIVGEGESGTRWPLATLSSGICNRCLLRSGASLPGQNFGAIGYMPMLVAGTKRRIFEIVLRGPNT